MKLNPQQAPLYGWCVIKVQLTDEAADDEDVDYFLLFAGSTQRHLTSTIRTNHDTLHALCPAHDCCEVVLVTLCAVSRDVPGNPEDQKSSIGRVALLAEHRFSFVQDLAFDMAQFLVSTAGRSDGLDRALLLDECQIPLQECERLDDSLALALHHLPLPPGWSLLGRKGANSTDVNPQETLLHFAARRGLFQVMHFLLQQSGAREALHLANREGHTPSSIAALRGHERLCELLAKAEMDLDMDEEAENVRLLATDARLVCHFPRLNTHTLTLRVRSGHDPPSLQKNLEQLLHLIHHLRAQGVSVLELQSDQLHTAAECCDGVELEATCKETHRQPESTLQCLETLEEDSCKKRSSPGSVSALNCGLGLGGNGNNSTLSVGTTESDPGLQEHGLVPPVDWVFPVPNAKRDCLQTWDGVVEKKEEDELEKGDGEEEETQQSLCSTQRLSIRKTSEPAPGEAEGESCRVGILSPVGCGKKAEETDGGGVEAVTEGRGATEGEETLLQEAANSATKREEQEEDTDLESAQPITPIGDVEDSVMGQPLSLEGFDSERKEASQGGERFDRGGKQLSLGLAEGLSAEKGLTECVSAPGDVPSTPLIDCGDVIEGPESAVLCSPDTNSLEQNQETAVRDYAIEQQQQGSAPETACHSGNCTETASAKELDGERAPESCCTLEHERLPYVDGEESMCDGRPAGHTVETADGTETAHSTELCGMTSSCSSKAAAQDSEMTHSLSSEDDGSFRSVGSSTTDIFHPTRDVGPEDQECPEGNAEGCQLEEPSDSDDADNNKQVSAASEGFPSELASAATMAETDGDRGSIGTPCESQWSASPQTMAALIAEWTGEEFDPRQSKESPSSGQQSGGTTVHKVDETKCAEANDSNSDGELELQESEVTTRVEDCPSLVEECDGEGDLQHREATDEAVVASAQTSGGVAEPEEDGSKVTVDECPLDEELILPHSESNASPPPSSNVDNDKPVEEELAAEEAHQNPYDSMDGASLGASQALEDMTSEAREVVAEEKETGFGEKADFVTIHRDQEVPFYQTCNTLLSESSASPSLPSRTSSTTSCPSRAHRDSGSDTESFLSTDTTYNGVFRKNDEPVVGGDSTSEVSVSCSSTDDTASICPSSSSLEGSQGLECIWSPVEGHRVGAAVTPGPVSGEGGGGGGGGGGEVEEEAKDRVSEVPQRSCLLRNSHRSLSPLRRHSWGPGKNNGGDAEMNQRSYSLEGLTGVQEEMRGPIMQGPCSLEPSMLPRQDSLDRGSLVSLTEEREDLVEKNRMHDLRSRRYRPLRNSCPSMSLPLTKSVSMLAISQRDIDGMRSFSSASGSVAYSISEEEPGPLRTDTEGKGVTKVSRTFSYIKNKMYKKTREKDREKKEKDKDIKEKDKKAINGHVFTAIGSGQAPQCSQCNKTFNNKECFHCSHCNSSVHKSCRDSLPACAKVKMKPPKQQSAVPDSSSFPAVTMRNKCGSTRERPWSAILSPEEHSSSTLPSSRRATTIMAFHGNNLSKSLSISNIAGPVFEEMPIKGLRYLSQSTDSLNRTNQVTESLESLTDEGTEMMDGQLMGEFEAEAKDLEADSWSLGVEHQYLQQLDKELVKRQDVIYELMQTEMHHIRTLRIMSEVYSKGLQKELQMDVLTVEKLFPALDDLIDFHTQHLLRLFERKRESQLEGGSLDGSFIINRIGDILVAQFSGSNGETMKRVYERFCSRHNEAVNFYKDLMTKDKRFKAFIKKKMSSTIVRRLGIPECILLVTQRITKYPVLIQRMLQHTKETDEDFDDLTESIRLLKDVIVAVDSKVNEHEKKRRLKEFHSRMDSKSIMVMKSGQVFARQDLLRRRLIHDGVLQLKSSQGRLKEVHALLLSDVFVFLQEKDQRFVFAMLDQRSTVISLQKLIVREVANEERGLFLITAGIEKPEMMEVLASSKDERNTWMQLIQDAMQSMDRDEDEGIPSETEDDKRQLETKTKEMRDQLRRKDAEIMSLLEEKVQLFRGMWDGLSPTGEEVSRPLESFFRSACSQELPRGASIMKDALQEVETLQGLMNGSLGGVMATIQEGGAGAGTVCLPRRAETFGGFDSHQMHSSKSGERDESDDTVGDLRRTESDSVLKKGGNANFQQLLRRNSEQVLHSVSNLHLLLTTLQAVVIQQDSFMEDQRQALSERSSSCSSLSRQQSSRPSSLIEQEKQRSLEKQRQELASLQRQQAAHAEERRRREREWELKEQHLSERESLLRLQEEDLRKQQGELEEEKKEVQRKKEEYQRDLERLRDAQRRLERDKDAVQRQLERMEEARVAERTPSTTSDEFQSAGGPPSLELEPFELSSSSSSLSSASQSKLQPQRSKNKGKSLNPFATSSSSSSSSSSNPPLKGSDANNQIPKNLLQLAKNRAKEGKEKKKKKGKGESAHTSDSQHLPEPPLDGEIFFC